MPNRILVIENEAFIRDNIIEILMHNGYEVHGAENGMRGLELAHQLLPDLILCDLMMIGMDGFAVLDHVRSDSTLAAVPFIFVTARADRQSMRFGMEKGADDYLVKPFTIEELLAAVETRLKRQQIMNNKTVNALEATKQQLCRMIAHELRTPLSNVTMSAQLLTHKLHTMSVEDITELLNVLNSGSRRLNRVVEQMILLTQIQIGQINAEVVVSGGRVEEVENVAAEAVKTTLNLSGASAEKIRLSCKRAECKIHICHYEDTLHHALVELMMNAVTFSPEQDAVEIILANSGNLAYISIADKGPGMNPASAQEAMDFFRQINRTKFEQQGMGIGLPLAKKIIDLHGGTLELKTAPGQGMVAQVVLPVCTNL